MVLKGSAVFLSISSECLVSSAGLGVATGCFADDDVQVLTAAARCLRWS